MNIYALTLHDFIRQNTTTTGTGNYTLGTTPLGFTPFYFGPGATFCYAVTDGTQWEVGRGTMQSDGTIARTEILHSYAGIGNNPGNSAINWGPGEKDMRLVAPARFYELLLDDLQIAKTDSAKAVAMIGRTELTTSDATQTTLYSSGQIDLGQTVVLDAMIVARTDDDNAKVWKVQAAASRSSSGTDPVIIGTPSINAIFETAGATGLAVAVDVDTATRVLRVRITGLAAKFVVWQITGQLLDPVNTYGGGE